MTFEIITVLQFPPKESLRRRVSLELRKGMNGFLIPFSFASESDYMQFPNTNNDLFMLAPSIILYPLLFVLAALSLPAKSTKLNLL